MKFLKQWGTYKTVKLRALKYDLKSNREGQIEQSSVSLGIKYFFLNEDGQCFLGLKTFCPFASIFSS